MFKFGPITKTEDLVDILGKYVATIILINKNPYDTSWQKSKEEEMKEIQRELIKALNEWESNHQKVA